MFININMKYSKLFFSVALIAGAAFVTGCKDDTEPGTEPSDVQGLFVNEVCSGGTDWIELYNATDAAIDLSGYHVQDNKGTDEEYAFPSGSSIEAKGFLVLEEGTFEFGISGSGDAIVLLDEAYAKIDEVIVPAMEDGFTYSRIEDGGSSWEIVEGGTKGRSNSGTPDDIPDEPEQPDEPGLSDSPVLINEVQGATIDGEQTDFIELYNPSSSSVDIGGFKLQDDKGAEEEYTVPEGTSIEAGAIMVFFKDETFTFGLGGSGDVVTVLDAEGNIVDTVEYPEMEDGSSYARIPDGSDNWQTVKDPTPGESNGGGDDPGADPGIPAGYEAIRLNELNGNDKFIELYNISGDDVDVSGMYFTKDDEDTFTAPEGTVIPAGGFLTVWSEKADGDHDLIFEFGLSADKSVKIELFAPDGTSLDVFKNLSVALGETWGEDDGKYDSKDLGSFARETDGTGDWYIMDATEGRTNEGAGKINDEKIEW